MRGSCSMSPSGCSPEPSGLPRGQGEARGRVTSPCWTAAFLWPFTALDFPGRFERCPAFGGTAMSGILPQHFPEQGPRGPGHTQSLRRPVRHRGEVRHAEAAQGGSAVPGPSGVRAAELEPPANLNAGKCDDAPRGWPVSVKYESARRWTTTLDGGFVCGLFQETLNRSVR